MDNIASRFTGFLYKASLRRGSWWWPGEGAEEPGVESEALGRLVAVLIRKGLLTEADLAEMADGHEQFMAGKPQNKDVPPMIEARIAEALNGRSTAA